MGEVLVGWLVGWVIHLGAIGVGGEVLFKGAYL